MQLKITTDYAIRIMLYLAQTNRITTTAEISDSMRIPHNYLTCMMGTLRKAGLVNVQFGQKGGYMIGRDPNLITLYDIVALEEGTLNISGVGGDGKSTWSNAGACDACCVYTPIQNKLESMLKSTTILQLLNS